MSGTVPTESCFHWKKFIQSLSPKCVNKFLAATRIRWIISAKNFVDSTTTRQGSTVFASSEGNSSKRICLSFEFPINSIIKKSWDLLYFWTNALLCGSWMGEWFERKMINQIVLVQNFYFNQIAFLERILSLRSNLIAFRLLEGQWNSSGGFVLQIRCRTESASGREQSVFLAHLRTSAPEGDGTKATN